MSSTFGELHDVYFYDFDPGATTATAVDSTWLSLRDIGEVVGILTGAVGALPTDEIQLSVYGATDASGTGATLIATGTDGLPNAVGDFCYVSATYQDFAVAMPNATHFMVYGQADTGTDEAIVQIIACRQRRSRAELDTAIS